MSTTYGCCRTQLKFAPGLVLGFLVEDRQTLTETRYALYANGLVLKSEQRPISDNVYQRGERWSEVQEIPAKAIFIGNYPPIIGWRQ